MKWPLLDKERKEVITVELPVDNEPDVVQYRGRTFYYNAYDGVFIETEVFAIGG